MDVLRLLIENSKVNLSQLNSNQQPLFFDPVIYFNNELFKLLIKYEINVNLKDEDGHNVIFHLMNYAEHSPGYDQKLYLETLQNMINIGVKINTKDLNGNSILHTAVNNKCEYTIKLLLNAKPDVYIRDNKGRTLIHNCIWKDNLRYFKIIHAHDQKLINKEDNFGILPINYAAFMGKYEIVKLMLEEGAHVNNTNTIAPKMIQFFKKFHENIHNLEEHANNKIEEQNLKLLANSMKKEFEIE
jgi:ankyrin repeat protein